MAVFHGVAFTYVSLKKMKGLHGDQAVRWVEGVVYSPEVETVRQYAFTGGSTRIAGCDLPDG
jgi:hypothetical protein